MSNPEQTQILRITRRTPGEVERRPQWFSLTQSTMKQLLAVLISAPIIVAILVWAFQALASFLFLLLLAWLMSIAMEPMVLWLIRAGMKRGLASAAVLFGGLLLTVGLIALFGQVFWAQAEQLKDQFPAAVTGAVEWVNGRFGTTFNTEQIYSNLNVTPERLRELAGQFGGGLLGLFGTLVSVIFSAVTILVFAYYLSADSIRLRQTLASFMPPRYQPVLITVWTIAVEKTGGYVVSKLIVALVSSAAYALFFLAIGLNFWLPLGLLVGIVAQFVPIIGTYIGVIIPSLFALLQDPVKVLWIVGFSVVYQQIESYGITPKVSNKTMDIHPAVALGAVFVGVALFGAIGALIGIPVAAAILTIVETFRRRHELLPELEALQADADGGPDDPGEEEIAVEELRADHRRLKAEGRAQDPDLTAR
ncbi:MAG TPA: AI-2E family transporter [Dermatophilaceae bacterium]|nr:AI-2E family transporter [Dermatophilaceae bacterium]